MENAARHAQSFVEIVARVEGTEAIVEIRDDGPGIPAEKVAFLMQRGKRLDEGGTGSGLGLAIAGEMAEAVGGSLSLHAADPGLVARVRLPLPAT